MKKKEKELADAGFTAAEPVAPPPPSTSSRLLTPLDVQQKEFGVARLGRGYSMRDVDEFLDQVTEAMSAMTEENKRLRGGVSPVVGTSDLDDVNRQADEIIRRARAEAATILAGARGQAMGTGAERAPFNALLAHEKEFLQELALLVQEHAESVKAMAKSARASATQTPPPPAPVAEAATKPSTASKASPPAKSPSAMPVSDPAKDRSAAPEAKSASAERGTQEAPVASAPGAGSTVELPKAEEPVRVSEPEPASVGRSDGDDDKGSGSASDDSLRELFWGED